MIWMFMLFMKLKKSRIELLKEIYRLIKIMSAKGFVQDVFDEIR